MRTLRPALVLLLALLLAPSALGQPATRTVSRSFDLAAEGAVAIDTYKGRVDVQTWDRDRARVEAKITGEKQTLVDDTKIRFEASGDRLEVETDYDELEANQKLFGLFRLGSVDRPRTDYTLRIPRTANLAVDTYSAATTVTRLAGDLRFDAYSASVTVDRLTGSLHADTYSGSVTIGRADGPLRADTYSGRLRADSIAATVAFSTYSGSATLDFATLTGDCSFDSYSGGVTATLPPNAGAVIETSEGALDSDLPLRIEQVGDDQIRATIGDGGPRLRFDTYSGTFSVRSR
jgi:spore coat protein U-like protein